MGSNPNPDRANARGAAPRCLPSVAVSGRAWALFRIVLVLAALFGGRAWGQGPVGHWDFDEGNGSIARDSSGNDYTAQLRRGVTWAEGRFGGGLEFDGTSGYVTVNNPARKLDIVGDFTLATWVKLATDTSAPLGVIARWDQACAVSLFVKSNGQLCYQYFDGTNYPTRGDPGALRTTPGQWHHVALALEYDTGEGVSMGRFYIDGVYSGALRCSPRPSTNAGTFMVGGLETQQFLKGALDELVVYDRVLSEAEIGQLCAGPVAAGLASTEGTTHGGNAAARRRSNGQRGRETFFLQPGDTVLAVGDAITVDGRLYSYLNADIADEYPDLAQAGDTAARGGIRFVRAGIAGDTAADGVRRLPELLERHKPTVVVICYGLNDMVEGGAGFPEAIRAMVMTLKASSIAVTLVTPPCPQIEDHPELAQCISDLTGMVERQRTIARAQRVVLADGHALMRQHLAAGKGSLSWGDGVHPNAQGHRLMADALRASWGFGKPLVEPARINGL